MPTSTGPIGSDPQSGPITFSGNFSRGEFPRGTGAEPFAANPGTPRKNEPLTFWYLTPVPAAVVNNGCTAPAPPRTSAQFNYLKIFTVNVGHTMTDCSGNYSLTIPGNSVGFCMAPGDYEPNTAYNPCFFSALAPGREYQITPGSQRSDSLNPTTDPTKPGYDTGGSTPKTLGGVSPYQAYEDFSFEDHGFFLDTNGNTSSAPTVWGDSGVFFVGRMPGSTAPIFFATGPPTFFGSPGYYYQSNWYFTNAAYTLNWAGLFCGQGQINILVKNDSGYYRVNNASITITDSCGASKTITGGGPILFGDPTWPDWKLWNSLTVNAGMPPDCNYAANPNLTKISYSASGVDITTNGTALPDTSSYRYDRNFNWTILLQDCSGMGNPPGAGANLKTRAHRQRAAGIGVTSASTAQISVSPSKDLGASLASANLYEAATVDTHDSLLDGTDALLVARAASAVVEVTRASTLMGALSPVSIASGLAGSTPVLLRTPERSVYLFSGGVSYRYDAQTQVLTAEHVYTGLASLATFPGFWTWGWRGDELWIVQDVLGGGISLVCTRDRGRTFSAATTPLSGTSPMHPRLCIDRFGVAFLAYWDQASATIKAIASRDGLVTWLAAGQVAAAPEQWPGGLWLDQKAVASYVDGGGTVHRSECHSLFAAGGAAWG